MSNTTFFDLHFRSQITDLRRRKKYVLKELNSLVLKAVLETDPSKSHADLGLRFLTEDLLQGLKQNTLTRIRNRCVLTGRSSTLKRFRLSRIAFREHAGSGKLVGVSKRLNK
uniref:Ribosomal protein S14 n=1 Tax=Tupiella akineta TaxID=160070 RepID=Q6UVV6_TUPAK|nr:ribosomal protein S14 [Tupiella akineta]AAQ18709.1 ribosomal protein S14 [Tupiella akineta]